MIRRCKYCPRKIIGGPNKKVCIDCKFKRMKEYSRNHYVKHCKIKKDYSGYYKQISNLRKSGLSYNSISKIVGLSNRKVCEISKILNIKLTDEMKKKRYENTKTIKFNNWEKGNGFLK